MESFKLVTSNIRGLCNTSKRQTIYRYLDVKKVDFACLQETYCVPNFEKEFSRDWSGSIFHGFTDSKHSRGVCIMINNSVNFKFISKHYDNVGRKVAVNIEIDGNPWSLVSVYCPNNERERINFIKNLSEWIKEKCISLDNLLIGGDFNCTLTKEDRRQINVDKSTSYLNKFINQCNLVDSWKKSKSKKCVYTYIDPSSRGYDSRIDFMFTTKSMYKQISSCSIDPAPAPDHRAVVLDLNICDKKRGPGYWKLNTSVLSDEEYVKGVTDVIQQTILDYAEIGSKLTWELCKVRIREYSIRYCTFKKRNDMSRIAVLEKQIRQLDDDSDPDVIKDKKALKSELDHLYAHDAKGAHIRSRAVYIEQGEKSTKFFLGLEKKRQTNNVIQSLKVGQKVVYKDDELLSAAADFYDQLYKSRNIADEVIDEYLSKIDVPVTLSDDENEILGSKIRYKECCKVVENLKHNKSPGLDGIPAEFYQRFWDVIGKLVVDSFNESFTDRQLSESQKMAVITLIYKKGDAQLLANYRPISLTNADYKILAF